MRAIVCPAYGTADLLRLEEVPRPAPRPHEILVRVHAGVVTPADCAFRQGQPFVVRLMYGLTRPRHAVLGVELAGEVEEVGQEVKHFEKGDRVFGVSPQTFGSHAEFVCLPEGAPIVHGSDGLGHEDAVSLCDGATTALTFLRDVGRVQPGQRVLVNGASGAVGYFAVQIAKHLGAIVTGVCSTRNLDLARSLGADHVVDYTQTDFTRNGETYDVIFDAVGKSSFRRCKRALSPRGLYLTTVPSLAVLLQMIWTRIRGGRRAKFVAAGLRQNKEDLLVLKELFQAGTLRTVIDRRFPLEQTAEAHRYVETGRKRGNVIVWLAEAR
jgi:NADPH:quinone reductase-like Zn-dependent oxidoreductase